MILKHSWECPVKPIDEKYRKRAACEQLFSDAMSRGCITVQTNHSLKEEEYFFSVGGEKRKKCEQEKEKKERKEERAKGRERKSRNSI